MTTSTVDEFSERLFDAVLGAMDMWDIYLGETLGFYAALAARPMTTGELAAESENNLRYTREWLEQQSITGIVGVDDPSLPPDQRRYSLPKAHAEVLTDRDSLSYLAPFVRMMAASGVQIPALADAYRDGGGVSWQQFGADMRSGQALEAYAREAGFEALKILPIESDLWRFYRLKWRLRRVAGALSDHGGTQTHPALVRRGLDLG